MSWKNRCYLLLYLFVIQMSCAIAADEKKSYCATKGLVEVFMPGRFCLFGEHSDWAAIYREDNPAIEKGVVVATGTDQGIYAHIKHHPDRFIFNATIPSFTVASRCEIPMTREELQEQTQCGGHFSYIASVALQILSRFPVQGIEIDNYKTDLSVRCGYGASGAVCLLVARAFNQLYNLGLTLDEEQEIAFMGETATQSRCSRMDYVCACGKGPFRLVFDRDQVEVNKISVGKDLYFVLVDLATERDTVKILNTLNRCYPFAKNTTQTNVQKYLGPMNIKMVTRAIKAIEEGDDQKIGELMKEAQKDFDEYVAPACPSQLTAPMLHKVLAYPPIQSYIYGGKGMGSQGDGSLQLIVKSKEAQEKVIRIIEKDFGMKSLPLTFFKT